MRVELLFSYLCTEAQEHSVFVPVLTVRASQKSAQVNICSQLCDENLLLLENGSRFHMYIDQSWLTLCTGLQCQL